MKRGRLGEELAAGYLKRAGWTLCARNWHAGRAGEIDIVGWDGDILVFVEVKTANTSRYGHPVTWVDARKQSQLARLAELFVAKGDFVFSAMRFDVITIDAEKQPPAITHLVDAFRPDIVGETG
ncbi:MAG TPA: YraN family protein [Candidatus Latescibacteria bacterium]|jgi:putative endonuclease|nr:YraN family protein [Candidatus Latescibacterota bacterium]HQE61130.1 YraN family protein [Candidatus Latescibacterota bacterium]HQI75634.1 YraN family protein [Candidatus Latescibacterota bacterium]HQK21895.1 YraN family protein [Candidatus Latescibacterota bacterium]HRS95073.1 YraN family protein [Candidatus Latescibacterota bacterium]